MQDGLRWTIETKLYRQDGTWYAERTVNGDYDGCDPLDIDADSLADAVAAADVPPEAMTEVIIRRCVQQLARTDAGREAMRRALAEEETLTWTTPRANS